MKTKNEYRVEGSFREYATLAEARKARKAVMRSLPTDARVSIMRREECAPAVAGGYPEFMWVPVE